MLGCRFGAESSDWSSECCRSRIVESLETKEQKLPWFSPRGGGGGVSKPYFLLTEKAYSTA